MSRISNALMQPGQAFGAGRNAAMVDVRHGGQNGLAPDLTEWVSNKNHLPKDLICILVEAPRGFRRLDNPDYWTGTLRSLVELHPLSIDGLSATVEVETVETAVGGSNQMQEDFVNVTESRSQPTFKWNEKYGMALYNFHRGWITELMMDPNTKIANIATRAANRPTDQLADEYSATMLFIEPDPYHNRVVQSWLGTNMFPKTSGENVRRRDRTQAAEIISYDIPYTGIFQYGAGVDAFSQKVLDGISLVGANPFNRAAFINEISADVAAMKKGYGNGVSELARSAVRV